LGTERTDKSEITAAEMKILRKSTKYTLFDYKKKCTHSLTTRKISIFWETLEHNQFS